MPETCRANKVTVRALARARALVAGLARYVDSVYASSQCPFCLVCEGHAAHCPWGRVLRELQVVSLPEKPTSELDVGTFIHCSLCMQERPPDVSPRDWARLSVGFTRVGLQVWCVRHDCNVLHVHYEGCVHPANTGRKA